MEDLSHREFDIAERYGAGKTYKEIAVDLFIAPSTVRNHIASIYRKLGVANKAEFVKIMSSQGSRVWPLALAPQARNFYAGSRPVDSAE